MQKFCAFVAAMLLILGLGACAPRNQVTEPQSSSSAPESSSQPEPLPTLRVTSGESAIELTPQGQEEDFSAAFTVSSADTLPLPETKEGACTVMQEGRQVFEGDLAALKEFVPDRNGSYHYEITVDSNIYRFAAQCKLPPSVKIPNPTVTLGEAMVIYVTYLGEEPVTAETNLGFTPSFFEANGRGVALLPVHYNTKLGTYNLTIRVGDSSFPYKITVGDREFVVQNLTVDENTTSNTIENNEANAEYNLKIEPLKKIADTAQYWEGTFLQPVEGRITTEFGMIRYINGSKSSTRHGGIDIANAAGTPVMAANSGRVIFADFIQLTGNTVVIEHGYGLKSWYYHMDSISVKKDQMVKKGENVGAIGSTGFSTGPHLHYALSVNNVYINPWTAFEKGIQ